jgi:flagellar hook-length control protein FliK
VGSPSTLQKPDPGAKAAELAGSQAGAPAGEPGPEASAAPPALEGTWTEGPHRPVDLREPARVAEARSPSVSTTEAAEQVSRQLVQMAHSGPASVRLRLYPEELGRIDIRLTHTPSGLEVTLSADQANTARALESQLGQLRQSLAEAGLSLTSVDIHQGSLSSQGSWHSGENLAHGAAPHAAFTRQTNQEADIHRTNHRTLTSDGNVHVDFFI